MASLPISYTTTYSYDNLNYFLYSPDPMEPTETEAEAEATSVSEPVEIELTINLQLDRVLHINLLDLDIYSELEDAEPLFVQHTSRIRLRILRHFYLANHIIGPLLSRLIVNVGPDDDSPDLFEDCIGDIMRHGRRLANLKSNRGRKLLPLTLELSGKLVQHVNFDDAEPPNSFTFTTALSESELEFERSNYGMIPAQESAVNKMLKRVRVVEDEDQSEEEEKGGERRSKRRRVIKLKGEDCVICLEELKSGSYASQMPCSHAFHSYCIRKWLKVSHDCPLCGFEMPTTSETPTS